jgi:cell division cycle 14
VLSPGVYSLTPEGYIPILKKLDVSCIVRFNSKCYDRNVFIVNGIRYAFSAISHFLPFDLLVWRISSPSYGLRHVDLYYEDGGNPTEEILQAFLQLCENERGAIAVHCKAGLGRTGTNIAAYMIKHYSYTAKETMAWCR